MGKDERSYMPLYDFWCLYFGFCNHMPVPVCNKYLHRQNILNKCASYIHTMIIPLTIIDYITKFTADNKNKRPICHANLSMIYHKARLHQFRLFYHFNLKSAHL